MSYEERDNSGALFKNERKVNPNQPDYTGTAMVNGRKMKMSSWVKKSKAGKQFMSFSFQEDTRAPQGDNYSDAGDGWN